jgi:hypothetical protein
MKINILAIIMALFFWSFVKAQDTLIHLNDIRILASHNSYKKFPHPKVIRFLTKFRKQLGPSNDPIQLDYGHLTLEKQLNDYSIRGFELDVYYDPKGGLYRKRKLNRFICGQKVRVKDPLMKKPGFKVLHIPDVDFETNYFTFIQAITELKNWSVKNPNHSPVFVNVEAKGSSAANESKFLRIIGFKKAMRMDSIAYRQLDLEINSVFDKGNLITPLDLKASYASIKERLTLQGWPLLSDCLGKIIFVLQGDNDELYKKSLLQGDDRTMFVYDEPGGENTAFVIRNNSLGIEKEVSELTKRYIIRSRTDAGTIEAIENNYTSFKSVLRSNAQIISTDYYKPDLRFSDFQIRLEEVSPSKPYFFRQK